MCTRTLETAASSFSAMQVYHIFSLAQNQGVRGARTFPLHQEYHATSDIQISMCLQHHFQMILFSMSHEGTLQALSA